MHIRSIYGVMCPIAYTPRVRTILVINQICALSWVNVHPEIP